MRLQKRTELREAIGSAGQFRIGLRQSRSRSFGDLVPAELQLITQVVEEQHRTADGDVVSVRRIVVIDKVGTSRCIEPTGRRGEAVQFSGIHLSGQYAGESFSIAGSAVPAGALSRGKDFNFLGDDQHTGVVAVRS